LCCALQLHPPPHGIEECTNLAAFCGKEVGALVVQAAEGVERGRADPSIEGPARAVLDSAATGVPPAPWQSKAAMLGQYADIPLCDGLRGTCGEGSETRAPAEVLVCHSALQWVSCGLRYGCGGQGISGGRCREFAGYSNG
jgi:hypothetical protein